MLTADLVRPRKRNGVLTCPPLSKERRTRATDLAHTLVAIAGESEGRSFAEWRAAAEAIAVPAKDRVLWMGLRKLLEDEMEFASAPPCDPLALRSMLFEAATRARREATHEHAFDRDEVLASVAPSFHLAPGDIDAALFADLKQARVLQKVPPWDAAGLVEAWELAQPEAVLLRATRVEATIACRDAGRLRRVFHALKFHRLLFEAAPVDIDEAFEGDAPLHVQAAWRLTIDGPMALFSQSTRYGLKLALALRVLAACDRCDIRADVRWGKARTEAPFAWSNQNGGPRALASTGRRDDVDKLLEDLSGTKAWTVDPEPALLQLPGVGLCVPDLALVHEATGEIVYVEVMGFWSREAVFKRTDLVRAGLPERVLFAVSSRLRVSEAALDDDTDGSGILVYKGVLRASAVLERATTLVSSS